MKFALILLFTLPALAQKPTPSYIYVQEGGA
jgi:hypothetical protein